MGIGIGDLGKLNPLTLIEGVVENASKTNYGSKVGKGLGDALDGVLDLDPKKVFDGLCDVGSAGLEQVCTVEFLGLAAWATAGALTGGVALMALPMFGLGGAMTAGSAVIGGGMLLGWGKDDAKPASAGPKHDYRGAEQVDPRAQHSLTNGTPTLPWSAGPATRGSSQVDPRAQHSLTNQAPSSSHVYVHNSTEVSVGSTSGADARGGVQGPAQTQPGEPGKEIDLAQCVNWAIERGFFTREELEQAGRIKDRNGNPLRPLLGDMTTGMNPDKKKELGILLEQKLHSNPEIRTTFESRYGKVDLSKDPIVNGFVYLAPPPAPPAPAPTQTTQPTGPVTHAPAPAQPGTGGGTNVNVSTTVDVR
ncbi:MAG: hypothetical protein ACK4N5_01325, partial [Myxococcales bacterium]